MTSLLSILPTEGDSIESLADRGDIDIVHRVPTPGIPEYGLPTRQSYGLSDSDSMIHRILFF